MHGQNVGVLGKLVPNKSGVPSREGFHVLRGNFGTNDLSRYNGVPLVISLLSEAFMPDFVLGSFWFAG
jgi:hypothetical protein